MAKKSIYKKKKPLYVVAVKNKDGKVVIFEFTSPKSSREFFDEAISLGWDAIIGWGEK